MTGQERNKMFFHADRAHAGAAPAMRDAKGFVEIEMPNIGAVSARPCKADLRVEVGAVEIDLSAVGMNDAANFANRGFENAVRGGISDHRRSELAGILLRLLAQIREVDIAVTVAIDDNDVHSSHLRGCRIGTVGR